MNTVKYPTKNARMITDIEVTSFAGDGYRSLMIASMLGDYLGGTFLGKGFVPAVPQPFAGNLHTFGFCENAIGENEKREITYLYGGQYARRSSRIIVPHGNHTLCLQSEKDRSFLRKPRPYGKASHHDQRYPYPYFTAKYAEIQEVT